MEKTPERQHSPARVAAPGSPPYHFAPRGLASKHTHTVHPRPPHHAKSGVAFGDRRQGLRPQPRAAPPITRGLVRCGPGLSPRQNPPRKKSGQARTRHAQRKMGSTLLRALVGLAHFPLSPPCASFSRFFLESEPGAAHPCALWQEGALGVARVCVFSPS